MRYSDAPYWPESVDSDADGLDNAGELTLGSDPTASDADGDGFSDSAEAAAGTHPDDPDSDDDGIPDGEDGCPLMVNEAAENNVAMCNDGIDNDCDRVTDCDDTDCFGVDCVAPDACTLAGSCGFGNGTCIGQVPILCDDSDACTVNSCDPDQGCEFTAVDCNDDEACTTDICLGDGGCYDMGRAHCSDDGLGVRVTQAYTCG